MCIYTHRHAHKLTSNACTVLNKHSTSVGTPYDPNQALQTAPRDVNIVGKPRRPCAFLSEFIRKRRHWEIQIEAHLKNLLFGRHCSFPAEVIREALGGACGSFQGLAEGCSPPQGSASPGASGLLASHTRALSHLFCFCVSSSTEHSCLWISDPASAKIRFKG